MKFYTPDHWNEANNSPNNMYIRGFNNVIISKSIREVKYNTNKQLNIQQLIGPQLDWEQEIMVTIMIKTDKTYN